MSYDKASKAAAEMPPPIGDTGLAWAEELVEKCEQQRHQIDTLDKSAPGSLATMRQFERTLLVRHGYVLGVLTTLLRCEKIGPVAYNTLLLRARQTIL